MSSFCKILWKGYFHAKSYPRVILRDVSSCSFINAWSNNNYFIAKRTTLWEYSKEVKDCVCAVLLFLREIYRSCQYFVKIYTFKAKLIGIKHANFAVEDMQFYLIKIIL